MQPDCFCRLTASGRTFNLAFEIDESTESLDSHAVNSVRKKLVTYHGYQDMILSQWLKQGKRWDRPRLRVIFLTRTVERAYHILALAAETNRQPSRRLVYAATQDTFVSDPDPLFAPIFVNHFGNWQSLIDLHPSAPFRKATVRLKPGWGAGLPPTELACPLVLKLFSSWDKPFLFTSRARCHRKLASISTARSPPNILPAAARKS